MRDCGEILEKEISRKKVARKDISEFVGVSPQNLSKVLRKDSIDAAQLERFCQFLNLDPADFFDYRPDYVKPGTHVGSIEQTAVLGSANVNFRDSDLILMNKLIEEKDARIANLEETVAFLKELLKNLSPNNPLSVDK